MAGKPQIPAGSQDTGHSVGERLGSARVLCIGDVMLDRYVYGEVERVSPEAPVPVLVIDSETHSLGGAGNVLRNLAALGTQMSFVSVVGNDDAGREIQNLLATLERTEVHVLVQPDRVTTVKTRFIAVNQHLLRADRESAAPLGPYIRDDLLRLAHELVISHDAVVISDYAKGVLTDGVALEIIKAAREAGTRVVVEPKGGDHIRYRGADLVTPQRRELAQATGLPVANADEVTTAARALIERCAFGAVLVDLGRAGLLLVTPGEAVEIAHDDVVDTFDPGGAEDAVVATVAAALGAGIDLEHAARLAGKAAAIVSGVAGAALVSAGALTGAPRGSDSAEATELRVDLAPQPGGGRQSKA